MRVRVINKSGHSLPEYATPQSAGLDLRAFVQDAVQILPGEHRVIGTGLFLEIPEGAEAQVRPRSGLAAKHGVTVLNAPGTIDSDYRGEVGVILINHGNASFEIKNGDRIAQLVFARVEYALWEPAQDLSDTDRSLGGFGSTGKN